jgi:sugar phosphate permease
VLAGGLGAAGLVLLAATRVHGTVALGGCLVAAGAAGASVHAASGRLILGWFGPAERGLAMGIRQSAQPLGVAVAAVTLPALSSRGLATSLLFLGGFCLAATALVLAVVTDPARPHRPRGEQAASPYRAPALWRIHAASAILVMPQFTVSTFALVFLVDARHWRAAPAGLLLSAGAAGGAASRLAAGAWSDRAGSRLRPMRLLALAIAVLLLVLAGLAAAASPLAVAVLLAGAVLVVSTNGLAFTAVAELAGPAWAGRALGIQNTGQNLVAAATPPATALLIAAAGYPAAFALAGALPLAAAALIPAAAEPRRPRRPRRSTRHGEQPLPAGRPRPTPLTVSSHLPSATPGSTPPP